MPLEGSFNVHCYLAAIDSNLAVRLALSDKCNPLKQSNSLSLDSLC
jgi:hypothetical protein